VRRILCVWPILCVRLKKAGVVRTLQVGVEMAYSRRGGVQMAC